MKVSREQVAYNRKLILDRASRLFRKKGFDGVGIVDIMKRSADCRILRRRINQNARELGDRGQTSSRRSAWGGREILSHCCAPRRSGHRLRFRFGWGGDGASAHNSPSPIYTRSPYKSCHVRKVRHGVFKNRTAQAGDRHVSRDGWSAHFGPSS